MEINRRSGLHKFIQIHGLSIKTERSSSIKNAMKMLLNYFTYCEIVKLIDLCFTLCRQYSSCVTSATSTNSKFYQYLQYVRFLVTLIIINTYGFKENKIDNAKKCLNVSG